MSCPRGLFSSKMLSCVSPTLQCAGQAAMGGPRAWFPYPFLMPKGSVDGGVLKPKLNSLLLCVTFNPLLFLATVLSSSQRCWETYRRKKKMH